MIPERWRFWWTDLRACQHKFAGIPCADGWVLYPACQGNRWHRGPHRSTVLREPGDPDDERTTPR